MLDVIIGSLIVTMIIYSTLYSIWNGFKLNIEIGKFYIKYESNPIKRFFNKK